MNTHWALFLMIALLSIALPALSAGVAQTFRLSIVRLRCEYLKDPLGIEVLKPRLSWVLQSKERGAKQTAYQVLVASTPELLAKNQGDLWDSGRVDSDQTIQVVYAGAPLKTRMDCYWKVRVWGRLGQATNWSKSAHWSMGLLDPADWQDAKWIAAPAGPKLETLTPHMGFHSQISSKPDVVEWVGVDLGKERQIDGVRLYCARPYDYQPDRPGFLFPVRFIIEVAQKADFSDAKTVADHSKADYPNPYFKIPVYRFKPVSARYVRVNVNRLAHRDGEVYGFALAEMEVLLGETNFAEGATVLASSSIESEGWGKAKLVDGRVQPDRGGNLDDRERSATMLRKEFDVAKSIKKATVSVTGLGLYELRINGKRVGDHLLAPEWTYYRKRIQYQTYDVTALLQSGPNAVAAQVAGGWWLGPMMLQPPKPDAQECLLMRLDIELADGSMQSVVTDPSWQTTTDGPIRRNGIYYGEMYDGTKEMPGWDQPGFVSNKWRSVVVIPYPDGDEKAVLVAQPNEPIRVEREMRPIKMTEPSPGVYMFDMGKNMVGWCRLTANAPKGTRITVRHAEDINDDGTLFVASLCGAAQINDYTWPGGEATLEPHFTFHGFRYVEVAGLPSRPSRDSVAGLVFHSDTAETGRLTSSSKLIEKILSLGEWSQRGNTLSVPTDCPQRAEREGWTGDIVAFSQAAIFQRDMAGFFTKWVPDLRDSQCDDGRFSDVAPHVTTPEWGFSGAPGWGDAGVIVPWRVYQNYADTRMLEEHFEAAKRWIDFIHAHNPNLLWETERGNDYGDWLNGNWMTGEGRDDNIVRVPDLPKGISEIPNDVFSTAFWAYSTEILSKMAEAIGRKAEAAKYGKLRDDIRTAFNEAYVSPDGRIKGDTQAGYALALSFNLLEETMRPKAMEHMLEGIRKFKNHVSTGFHSSHRLMLELTRNGRHDEAWRLINVKTVPSWGYLVEMGATTVWERWDAVVPGRTGVIEQSSRNHWGIGSVNEWIWRELGGINPDDDQPAYKHFLIRPRPCPGLTWVKARYDSIRGMIVSDWKLEKGRFTLRVKVPVGSTATVYVPTKDAATVMEGGKPASQSEGVKLVKMEDVNAAFEVVSGQYVFESEVGR
jgi:alpha-L-rhamnosidase